MNSLCSDHNTNNDFGSMSIVRKRDYVVPYRFNIKKKILPKNMFTDPAQMRASDVSQNIFPSLPR